jgi:predicted PurR-regulated permease PerM
MISASGWPSLPRARTIGWAALGIIALILFPRIVNAFFALFAGVLLALFLGTLSRFVSRKTRIPYKAVVAGLTLLAIAAAAVTAILAGPRFVEQVDKLFDALPRAVDQLRWKWQGSGLGEPPKAEELRPQAASVGLALMGSVEVLAGVVFVFVGVYGALQPDAYVRTIVRLVPKEKRPRAEEILHDAGHTLARWLVGRAVAMAFVGLASAIGLSLLHVPLALVLGIAAGLLAFVEYAGAIISAIPPMILVLSAGPLAAVWVAVLFTGIHVVEGYVLTPLLARTAVRFPPALTLAAQTLFGAAFGVLGLTFATPLCVVGATLVKKLYIERSLGDVSEGA